MIAGPCVVENTSQPYEIASYIMDVCNRLDIPLIFKSSYKKANRTRVDSFTGIGDEQALEILGSIRERLNLPVITDIHAAPEAEMAAQFVDVLQIPAFLSRQTEIITAAADTGKIVNIKKGQFLSPESVRYAAEKVQSRNNANVMITERGTMFGYQNLVVDFGGIPVMQSSGVPVILDCTHSIQRPNQTTGITSGNPAVIETMARAGIAVGVDGLFIETHPNPAIARSDSDSMLPLNLLEPLLKRLLALRETVCSLGQ